MRAPWLVVVLGAVWVVPLVGWLAGAYVAVTDPQRLPTTVHAALPLRWDTMAVLCFGASAIVHWAWGVTRLRGRP